MKDEIISTIARKLKKERLERGFTIQYVSEKSGLSKGLISKIENSRTIPSMPVFFAILKSMSLSPALFFESIDYHNDEIFHVVRSSEHQPIQKENRPGFHYHYIMSQQVHDINMEVVLLELEPKARGIATATDGFEFKYLLQGKVNYRIDNKNITLEPGDTIFFDASLPHRPENQASEKAVLLVFYFMRPK